MLARIGLVPWGWRAMKMSGHSTVTKIARISDLGLCHRLEPLSPKRISHRELPRRKGHERTESDVRASASGETLGRIGRPDVEGARPVRSLL